MLTLVRDGAATSRTDLVRYTGLSRATVAQRLELLVAHQLVSEQPGTVSTGGRPPSTLTFNRDAGVVLAASLETRPARFAVTDLSGALLGQAVEPIELAEGPAAALERTNEQFAALLDEVRRDPGDVRGVGVGVPGPVSFPAGTAMPSPAVPGWDGFAIAEWFAARYRAPVVADSAVNMMALGEHRSHWREFEHLLFVDFGPEISCGIVASGRIVRGSQGAAGDIGHTVLEGQDVPCRCGGLGCLEAVAGAHALADQLAAQGLEVTDLHDLVRLAHEQHRLAIRAIREAGRRVGEVLAVIIELFDPQVVVLGGGLGTAGEHLLAGVRELSFKRALPRVTRDLVTAHSRLGERAGVLGAATMVIEHVLAPEAVDRALGAAGS